MQIQLFKYSQKWGYEIVSPNNHVLMTSTTCYRQKKNALAAARKIAGRKMKLVVKE
jgi:hypothetical protein